MRSINLAGLDLSSIRLVVLCAEVGSLSATSHRAHCSISAASQRLSALEDAVDRKLFERNRRGVKLTSDGELFVRHAREILMQVDLLKKSFASLGNEQHVL
jgi:DNA-binding transcriptional LysR family regulator